MPRPLQIKSFLPEREVEICQRLRAVRRAAKWSQPDFAKELGISRVRLASYEYAKAPLRYEIARLVCYRFNISQRWLAEGILPMKPSLDISPHAEALFPVRILFSDAYDTHLKDELGQRTKEIEAQVKGPMANAQFDEALLDNWPPVGAPLKQGALFYIDRICGFYLATMPHDLQGELLETILTAAHQFYHHNRKRIEAFHEQRRLAAQGQKPCGQFAVDIALRDLETSPAVSLKNLMMRVREATTERGARSALGREMGVSRQAVDRWISGASAPDAAKTLRLVLWVEQAEAQQKTGAVRAATPTAPTTQTKAKHENRPKRSGPRKQ